MRDIPAMDVLVVGGGPAGLSAALALGRALKKVLLCDTAKRRNAAAEHMHGFVSRDGIAPSEFRRIARAQLEPYDVSFKEVAVRSVVRTKDRMLLVAFSDGSQLAFRRILLATGMVDDVPNLPGIRDVWGHAVFACPYCHGWELRERPWGILARDASALEFAAFLTGWTGDVVAFTDGERDISSALRDRAAQSGVVIEARSIARLAVGPDHRLTGIVLNDGCVVPREALVVRPRQRQVPLVAELGLELDAEGFVRVDGHGETSVPGVYAAGDLASPMQAAVLAAAAGTRTAYALNHQLNLELTTSSERTRNV